MTYNANSRLYACVMQCCNFFQTLHDSEGQWMLEIFGIDTN